MIKNNVIIGIIALVALLIGILIGSIISTQIFQKESFYNVRLIEVIQVFITVLIAIFITYFIGSKINNNLKKKGITDEILSKFQEKLTNTIEISYDYIHEPDNIKQKKIINSFKKLSILLGVIKDIKKLNKNSITINESFYDDFWKFKEAITDTPFGQKKPKYSEHQIAVIDDKYDLLLKQLYECKLKLYS